MTDGPATSRRGVRGEPVPDGALNVLTGVKGKCAAKLFGCAIDGGFNRSRQLNGESQKHVFK